VRRIAVKGEFWGDANSETTSPTPDSTVVEDHAGERAASADIDSLAVTQIDKTGVGDTWPDAVADVAVRETEAKLTDTVCTPTKEAAVAEHGAGVSATDRYLREGQTSTVAAGPLKALPPIGLDRVHTKVPIGRTC